MEFYIIELFRIKDIKKEYIYQLEFLNLYKKLYNIFHISLLKKYKIIKGINSNHYLIKGYSKLEKKNKKEWKIERIIVYKIKKSEEEYLIQ